MDWISEKKNYLAFFLFICFLIPSLSFKTHKILLFFSHNNLSSFQSIVFSNKLPNISWILQFFCSVETTEKQEFVYVGSSEMNCQCGGSKVHDDGQFKWCFSNFSHSDCAVLVKIDCSRFSLSMTKHIYQEVLSFCTIVRQLMQAYLRPTCLNKKIVATTIAAVS